MAMAHGYGLGGLVGHLLRIVQHHALERAVGVERDEGRAILLARAFGDQKRGAVVGGLGQAAVADAVVRRNRLPDAVQGDAVGTLRWPAKK